MKKDTFRYAIALTVAGSDSSGGAGIQADLKTFSALGVYGASAITAVTSQNSHGVYGVQSVEPLLLMQQIKAVCTDLDVNAVKIGMLPDLQSVAVVSEEIPPLAIPVVYDPVMISSSGEQLMKSNAVGFVKQFLLPYVTLLTPNLDEATALSGVSIQTDDDRARAAHRLLDLGCQAVLIKGGHWAGELSVDYLFSPGHSPVSFQSNRVHTRNTHGTGCTLSSAITAHLALGRSLPESIHLAKEYITRALQEGEDVDVGCGNGALNHFFAPIPLYKLRR